MAPPFLPAEPLRLAGAVLLAILWQAPAASQQHAATPVAQAAARTPDPVAPLRCSARPVVFGCANAANLMETASPADLAVGRPLSSAAGWLEVAAVGRLQADRVKDLRREGPDSAAGGSR
ncbi:MAG: hypothetical protein KGZ61_12840 [Sandarakinorhabdus sp.]|nr:hypothetical protein [Sandarakinorhabdus sp.]